MYYNFWVAESEFTMKFPSSEAEMEPRYGLKGVWLIWKFGECSIAYSFWAAEYELASSFQPNPLAFVIIMRLQKEA